MYPNNCNNFKYHNDNFYQNHLNKKNIYFTTNWHVTSTVTLLITFQIICILHLVRYSPLCSLISDRWKRAYWRWRLDNGVPKQQHDPIVSNKTKQLIFDIRERSESHTPISETGAAIKAVNSLYSSYRVGFHSSLLSCYFSNNTAVKRTGWRLSRLQSNLFHLAIACRSNSLLPLVKKKNKKKKTE